MKRKDWVMQLTWVFSGHFFQNCFKVEKSAWETSKCAASVL